jgi:putative flippase GtrA
MRNKLFVFDEVIKMLKRALKFAIWPSVGVTIGLIIIPRIMFSNLYNETFPPIFVQACLNFIVGYIVSFLLFLLIEWIKLKAKKWQ